jgi:solute carrier family 25, member 45/47
MYGAQLRFMQRPFREDEKKRLWERHVFVAGSCAGFFQSFLACPIEVIKVRLQTLTCEYTRVYYIYKLMK